MIPTRSLRFLALATLLLVASAASAQTFGAAPAAPTAEITLIPLSDTWPAGGVVEIGVLYSVPEGTHMTDNVLKITGEGAEAGKPVFPAVDVEDEVASYWKGDVMATLPLTLPVREGPLSVTVAAGYQLCEDRPGGVCYMPAEASAVIELEVGPPDPEAVPVAALPSEEEDGLQGRLLKALNEGSWLAFVLVFLGGVLTSFTPCVYPMIPITISFIGGSAKGNPLKGFVLSLWYVLGIAIVYSSLGLLAAATGGAFGQATQTPVFAWAVAVIIGAMGLSMAGLFDIQLPSSMTSRMGGARTGFLGPILMGMAMGLIAAPCVGPVLVVLLTWVASTGNLFMGFWLLFTFALGLGLLFLALGTFSGLLGSMPGAGGWMETVKHVFAVVLFALALWFLRLYVPQWALFAAFGLALALSVSAWGAWEPLQPGAGHRAGFDKGFLRLLWAVGAALLILGGVRGFVPELLPAGGAVVAHEAVEPDWTYDEHEGFARAAAEGRPLMMDFWAEWCPQCIELDHKTYNQTEILALAERFVSVKMDMTDRNAPSNKARVTDYEVVGMPTVIFFAPDGEEITRFSGFKGPEDMAAIMNRVLETVAP